MRWIAQAYAVARHLSLDVAAGSLGSAALVAAMMGVTLPKYILILPLAVLLVYTLDHLLDARRISLTVGVAHTARHRFHQQYWRPIASVWLLLAVLGMVLVATVLPLHVIQLGLGVLALTVLHLLVVALVRGRIGPWLHKEVAVAMVYTLGVGVVPVALYLQAGEDAHWSNAIIILSLLLVPVLTNLLTIGWFELRVEHLDQQTSVAQHLGQRRLANMIYAIAAVGMLFCCLLMIVGSIMGSIRVIPMVLMFVFICWQIVPLGWPSWFAQHERYRAWGDAGFLLGLLTLQ